MDTLCMERDEEFAVLIVGGSVVGLSMALFLAWHGVPTLLVERHFSTSIHPRAGAFSARSMEFFRQVGLELDILAQEMSPEQRGEMGLRVESLVGKVLDSTEAKAHQSSAFIDPFPSPTRTAFVGQDKLEPLLRARAEALGCDIRFGTEMLHFEQHANGVCAQIRERTTGQQRCVHAQYLVAADGNRSAIRQQLGIESYGYGTLGQWVSTLFRTDLSKVLHRRKITLCFVNNPTVDGIMGQVGDRWSLFANIKTREGEGVVELSEERNLELVRAAIGIPDQPVEIISTLSWELASRVAEQYQHGRIFLVGDAAHVMTTMGAFGANTGIADAHNLAWKLAFVLKNQAHVDLLATYGQERQPVADLSVGLSTALYAYRLPHIEQRDAIMQSAVDMLDRARQGQKELQPTAFSAIYGYRYQSSAILSEEDEGDAALFENEPSGRPGTRAPHVWLERDGERLSILDLYGKNFVLLTGPDGKSWYDTCPAIANWPEVPIETYTIGLRGHYIDSDANFLTSYGISTSGAVLVRPDGFIAWRIEGEKVEASETILK